MRWQDERRAGVLVARGAATGERRKRARVAVPCHSADACLCLRAQPFQWSFGQAKPTQNAFSWTNLSSLLYVEQPVGTGFSQGKPNISVSRNCGTGGVKG